MSIQVLREEVASQIAAGEVIERPASVVKELLENALDAHAGQITIQIQEAGRRRIEIADDGEGIPQGEMHLAVARHATSKLRTAEDLFHITTLGFRGEALASVASVTRLSMTSRYKTVDVGSRIIVEGGQIRSVEQVGVPAGTVVSVEDLFFNVPARLKFLKKDMTERQQIDALVTRYALAYPHVRIHLFQDGRPVLQTSGNGDRREILASLYGIDVARQMLEVILEESDLSIGGYISPVSLTRSNRREMTFFVNGRWVQDSALSSALLQAYHTFLMVGRYPLSVLLLSIDPELVDVNVHPAKAEVRFREPDRIFTTVQRAVRRGLLASSPVPQLTPSWTSPQPSWQGGPVQKTIDLSWEMAANPNQEPLRIEASIPALASEPEPLSGSPVNEPVNMPQVTSPGMLPLLRLVGQIGGTYLVAEGPDGLYLLDQHAAHERVLFERFMKTLAGPVPAQALLEPTIFHLPPESTRLLTEQIPVLESFGFQIEPFGPNTFRVRAIPALLVGSDPVSAVRVIVEEFEEDETPLQSEKEARLVARICKRVAVKGGQILSQVEQLALLRDLETCQAPRTCPHGRPTMIHLSVDLLERQFGRRGSR